MVDVTRRLRILDRWQRSFLPLAFVVGVVKKYGEDHGGYQAALLTYYGFLSLFPLLLVLTTLVQWLPGPSSHLRGRIISAATDTFPVIGEQLQQSVHGFSKTGLPLLIGLLILLYGARGVADAFRHAANNIWRVPLHERSSFWAALGKNYSIVFGGGAGFLAAAIVAGYASGVHHDWGLRAVFLLLNLVLLFLSFQFLMGVAVAKRLSFRDIWVGAAVATIGLFVLQNLGTYLFTHELKNLGHLYGTFAVVLGMLFWLYLQTQLVVYAMEVDTVRKFKLWPRDLF